MRIVFSFIILARQDLRAKVNTYHPSLKPDAKAEGRQRLLIRVISAHRDSESPREIPSREVRKSKQFGIDPRPSGLYWRWLGPTHREESSVPSRHRFGFDNQKLGVPPRVPEGVAEEGEKCSVSFVESRLFDLSL